MANWVNKVRMTRQSLSSIQLQALNAVGFVWAQPKGQVLWNERFAQLQAYHAVHGHCNVPTKCKVSGELQKLHQSPFRSHVVFA
jgi:Helicase associated domain